MALPAVAHPVQPILVPATKRPGSALPCKAAPAKARTTFPVDLRASTVNRTRFTPGEADIVYVQGVATAVQPGLTQP
eukprot:8400226-Heterocapsa_arctica.AAC.1